MDNQKIIRLLRSNNSDDRVIGRILLLHLIKDTNPDALMLGLDCDFHISYGDMSQIMGQKFTGFEFDNKEVDEVFGKWHRLRMKYDEHIAAKKRQELGGFLPLEEIDWDNII